MEQNLHPNMSLLMRINLRDLDSCSAIFTQDFVWHYFNSKLPELQGDYVGLDGLARFFARLNEKGPGNFQVNAVDAWPVGDELVVSHVCNRLDIEGEVIEFDAVVVWRIIDDKFAEAWDIPAVNTVRSTHQ